MKSSILKRVLCATDFSENAAAALEAAVALAGPSKAEVLVIHVVPCPRRSAVGMACLHPPSAIDEEKPTDVIESLNRLVQPGLAAGARIERVQRRGDPGDEIVCEAQRANADLIVMGRHSRSVPSRWFLGSVAEHVVGKAPCPVMVVEAVPRGAGTLQHVLCAVDLGETSLATLTYAAALASALEAELLILHVVATPEEDGCAPGALDTPVRRRIEDARIRLAALAGTASVPSGRAEERVAAGVPYEEILAATRENRIDVVVVGSHGGGIVDRQFIGSTTLHLLRRSECAVLVVPARVTAEAVAETEAKEPPIGVARGVAGRNPGSEVRSVRLRTTCGWEAPGVKLSARRPRLGAVALCLLLPLSRTIDDGRRGEAAEPFLGTHVLVTWYGNPHSAAMGVLGQASGAERAEALRRQAAAYEPLTSKSVATAYHSVAVVAQRTAGADGKWRRRESPAVIRALLEEARAEGFMLVLDVQPGQSSIEEELEYLAPFLSEPDVHLALDPEFDMSEGQVPGRTMGHMHAAEVNAALDFLEHAIAAAGLPPKILIVHQFTLAMLREKQDIRDSPSVDVVLDMDGFGSQSLKMATYTAIMRQRRLEFAGVKLFYKQDADLWTPEQLMALDPVPAVVIYQ